MGELIPIDMVVTLPLTKNSRVPVIHHGIEETIPVYTWLNHEKQRWIDRGFRAEIVEVTNREGVLCWQLEQYGKDKQQE